MFSISLFSSCFFTSAACLKLILNVWVTLCTIKTHMLSSYWFVIASLQSCFRVSCARVEQVPGWELRILSRAELPEATWSVRTNHNWADLRNFMNYFPALCSLYHKERKVFSCTSCRVCDASRCCFAWDACRHVPCAPPSLRATGGDTGCLFRTFFLASLIQVNDSPQVCVCIWGGGGWQFYVTWAQLVCPHSGV